MSVLNVALKLAITRFTSTDPERRLPLGSVAETNTVRCTHPYLAGTDNTPAVLMETGPAEPVTAQLVRYGVSEERFVFKSTENANCWSGLATTEIWKAVVGDDDCATTWEAAQNNAIPKSTTRRIQSGGLRCLPVADSNV